jgi:hypothetical protein
LFYSCWFTSLVSLIYSCWFTSLYQRGKSTAVSQWTTDNTMVNRKRYQRGKLTAVNQWTTDNTMVNRKRYQWGKLSFIDLQLLIYLFVLSVVHWFTAVDLPLCIICRSWGKSTAVNHRTTDNAKKYINSCKSQNDR